MSEVPSPETIPGEKIAQREIFGERRRVTLITGASGGIGADLARVFAKNGHDLVLIARSRQALDALASEIAKEGRPAPLVLVADLLSRGVASRIISELETLNIQPEILVNNAGFGLLGEAASLDPAEQLAIIDLNVRLAAELTLHFLPAIRATRGKILNVASVAAYFPGGPGMAVYYASKAFLLSFSQALSQELRSQGVAVTALCPGYTKTGFQARAGFGPNDNLAKFPSVSSVDVAQAGYVGLMAGKRTIVPGLFNKITIWLLPFLPNPVVLWIISHLQQKRAQPV